MRVFAQHKSIVNEEWLLELHCVRKHWHTVWTPHPMGMPELLRSPMIASLSQRAPGHLFLRWKDLKVQEPSCFEPLTTVPELRNTQDPVNVLPSLEAAFSA